MAERKLEAPSEDTSLQEATCDPHRHQGTPRHERARLREARKHRGTNRGNANLAAIRWVEGDSSLPHRGDKLEQRHWVTSGLIPYVLRPWG